MKAANRDSDPRDEQQQPYQAWEQSAHAEQRPDEARDRVDDDHECKEQPEEADGRFDRSPSIPNCRLLRHPRRAIVGGDLEDAPLRY